MKYHQGIETLLHSLHVSPLKRYGQNFLVDETIINTIIKHANIQDNDVVMEIGPGLGALTQKLNFEQIHYISYEIDRTFHQYLLKQYPTHSQHNLGNFLKATPEKCDVIMGN
ncbi:MAG: rRNA adenine N-6-methyltransferase family protein, partial [Bacilli bacterium]